MLQSEKVKKSVVTTHVHAAAAKNTNTAAAEISNKVRERKSFMVELDQYKYALAGYRQAVEEIRNSL